MSASVTTLMAACGALRTFVTAPLVRCLVTCKAAAGRRSPLRCGGPPGGRTALRALALAGARALARHETGRRACFVSGLAASVPGPGRGTRFVRCAHFAQPAAPKSEHDPRFALGPGPCAPRRRRGAAPAARPRLCKHRWASATQEPTRGEWLVEPAHCRSQRPGRVAGAAPLRRREAQGAWPRAQRASCTDLGALV